MISAAQSSYWAALRHLTARHGRPAVSHRSDVSGHSGAAAPRSQPLCPGTDSPRVPLDHIHACLPPVCRSHWSPHSRISPVVWFCLGEFKSISSSRRTDTHQRGSCVLSCPDAACHRVCGKKRFLQTGQCFHVRWYQILRLDLSFCGVTTDSFSTKAPVKESEKPQLVHPCRLTFHYPWLSREFKARSGGIFFALFLLHNLLLGYFHLPRSTSERIFPWKLL